MIAPLIHLNGDTKNELQEKLAEACRAISQAQAALRDTAPNQRNFYPLEADAFTRARAEYQARQEHLQLVYNELMAIFDAIDHGRTETE